MTLLFGQAPSSLDGANACFQHDVNWTAYRFAYEEAVESLVPEASPKTDYMIYPLLFCGRQALELGLKEMIQVAQALHGAAPNFPKTHSLQKLWSRFEAELERTDEEPDPAAKHFARLIREFDEIDRQSDRFRYPEQTDGSSSHDRDELALPHIVDVSALHQSLKAMFNFISGVVDYLKAAEARR